VLVLLGRSIHLERGSILSGFGNAEIASSLTVFFGTVLFSSTVCGLFAVVVLSLWRTLVPVRS